MTTTTTDPACAPELLADRIRSVCAHLADRLRAGGRTVEADELEKSGLRVASASPRTWAVADSAAHEAQRVTAKAIIAGVQMPAGTPPILLIDGVRPPWLLAEALERTDAGPLAPSTALIVAAASWDEVAQAAAIEGADGWLCDPRVHIFCGDEGVRSFARWLDDRSAYMLSGSAVGVSKDTTPTGAALSKLIARVNEAKGVEDARLRELLRARDQQRDASWWLRRFDDTDQEGEPLRVLVASTIYSTYVQHAAAGLTEAFSANGCEAQLLIEPDRHTRLSTLAYLRTLRDFDPDLVVTINFPRATLGGVFPKGLPCVTWIQDAMAHLFDPKTAPASGLRDYAIGHLERSMLHANAGAVARARCVPVVASEATFAPRIDGPNGDDRFACDVAWVSNHGEPPERLQANLIDTLGVHPSKRERFERLGDSVRTMVREATLPDRRALDRCGREWAIGAGFPQKVADQVVHTFVMPLAERELRHQTARWAADICARRGWCMRIFGLGWESAPGLSRLAEGPIEHGDDLRKLYASGRATPHVNLGSTLHQRVFECALAGGLPLCRRTHADVHFDLKAALRDVLVRTDALRRTDDTAEYPIADHPELLRAAAQRQRLGWKASHRSGEQSDTPSVQCLTPEAELLLNDVILRDLRPLSAALGDLSETTFADESELESLLERAIERPRWRASLSDGIARRVRENFSMRSLARGMTELVRDNLRDEIASA
ncbi:MAG: hypothetical protein AAGH64_02865 [Planctomycetota bacterium]